MPTQTRVLDEFGDAVGADGDFPGTRIYILVEDERWVWPSHKTGYISAPPPAPCPLPPLLPNTK